MKEPSLVRALYLHAVELLLIAPTLIAHMKEPSLVRTLYLYAVELLLISPTLIAHIKAISSPGSVFICC